jgi:hypothetical protein
VARRIDPANLVVAFFQDAPLDQAATVLSIVRGILARRQPKTKPLKAPQASVTLRKTIMPKHAPDPPPNGAAVAEAVPAHVKTTKGGLVLEEPDRP